MEETDHERPHLEVKKVEEEETIQKELEMFDRGIIQDLHFNKEDGNEVYDARGDDFMINGRYNNQKEKLRKLTKLKYSCKRMNTFYVYNGKNKDKSIDEAMYSLRCRKLINLRFNCGKIVKTQFGFYSKSLCKLNPIVTNLISLCDFLISHHQFCRILMSSICSRFLRFTECEIRCKNNKLVDKCFDDRRNPKIELLNFLRCRVINTDDGSHDQDNFIKTLAESPLQNSLTSIDYQYPNINWKDNLVAIIHTYFIKTVKIHFH
ncbi:unnamed protein product [Moneuplotes crassus]|uniref:Uncharacterized protein n=1 Tax=Euplotes crassus TaxID=5936 RepID=A0AAD1XVF1_EUPCR|nr:unnamed protein product [Moneuplotes crassus]